MSSGMEFKRMSWIITLRRKLDGSPVGGGDIVTAPGGRRMEVDNWAAGLELVYCRPPGHTPKAPVREFAASALGLYFGTKSEHLGFSATRAEVLDGWRDLEIPEDAKRLDEAHAALSAPKPPKAPKLWFVASYGDGGLDVQFYSDPLAYGRAVLEAKIAWEQGHNETGEDIDSYTNGEVKA